MPGACVFPLPLYRRTHIWLQEKEGRISTENWELSSWILSSIKAPQIVVFTTRRAANDDKVGIMANLGFHYGFHFPKIMHVCILRGSGVGAGMGMIWLQEFTPEDISIIDKIRKSHNTLFRTEMCAFRFWMMYCGIWDICIVMYRWHVIFVFVNFHHLPTTHLRHADFTNPPHYHQNTCQNVTCSRNLRFWWEVIILDAYVAISSEDRHNSYTWQYTIKTKKRRNGEACGSDERLLVSCRGKISDDFPGQGDLPPKIASDGNTSYCPLRTCKDISIVEIGCI